MGGEKGKEYRVIKNKKKINRNLNRRRRKSMPYLEKRDNHLSKSNETGNEILSGEKELGKEEKSSNPWDGTQNSQDSRKEREDKSPEVEAGVKQVQSDSQKISQELKREQETQLKIQQEAKKIEDERIVQLDVEMQKENVADRCERLVWEVIPSINEINHRLSSESQRNIIEDISWRVKSAESMVKKLERKGREVSLECAMDTLNDLAGIRVICSFQDDVYRVAKEIKNLPSLKVLKRKNYIVHPKASGYRSIHLIVEVPSQKEEDIRVEIQIRSVAMNYWAILDHQLCYKNEKKEAEKIRKELRSYAIAIAEIDKKMLKLRKRIEKI